MLLFFSLVGVLQAQLSSGKQLVHTEYLQLLTAMAIGLGMNAPLVSPPHPPHLPPIPTPLQWQWLKTFTSAVSMATSFRKKQPLIVDEAAGPFDLPLLRPGEKFQPKVCSVAQWTGSRPATATHLMRIGSLCTLLRL